MANFKAAISLSKTAEPADAQRPRRRVVLVAMAAGMAEIGVLTVPP